MLLCISNVMHWVVWVRSYRDTTCRLRDLRVRSNRTLLTLKVKYWSSGKNTNNYFRRGKIRTMNAMATSLFWKIIRLWGSVWKSREIAHLSHLLKVTIIRQGMLETSCQPDTHKSSLLTNTISTSPVVIKNTVQCPKAKISTRRKGPCRHVLILQVKLTKSHITVLLLWTAYNQHSRGSISQKIQKI